APPRPRREPRLDGPEPQRGEQGQTGHRDHREPHRRPDDVEGHEEVVETEIGPRPDVVSTEVDDGPEGKDRRYRAEEDQAADPVRFAQTPLALRSAGDEPADARGEEAQEEGDAEGGPPLGRE